MTEMFKLTAKSGNMKTGKIAVSMSSCVTCPDACPFRGNGCYASSGPLAIHWRRQETDKAFLDEHWNNFLSRVGELQPGMLFRHNQAGDLIGSKDFIDAIRLEQLRNVCEQRELRCFTYTHYPVIGKKRNLKAIEAHNSKHFVINLSANSPSEVDKLLEMGVKAPVVTLIKSTEVPLAIAEGRRHVVSPAGNKIMICPNVFNKELTCEKCQACMNPKRKAVIGFPAHGSCRRRADAVVEATESYYE